MKARENVMMQIQNLISQVQLNVQAGAVDPNQAQARIMEVQQQMQNPAELEKLIAIEQMGLMRAILADITPQGQDPMNDPLVQIRMQELTLKQQAEERKAQDDEARIMLDAAKLRQQATSDAARIESSEDIAAQRNATNQERIDVQRAGMMMRNRNAS